MLELELYTTIFTVCFAWYSKIPVLKMINNGASIAEEKEFHNASAACRVLFVVSVCASVSGSIFTLLFLCLTLGLVQWLLFDISLNIALGKKWHYIGTTAKLDRLLREVYDEDAGKWKAALVLAVIVLLNLTYYL